MLPVVLEEFEMVYFLLFVSFHIVCYFVKG